MRRSLVPILFAKPGWVLPGATLDMDFANNRAWRKGVGLILPAPLLTTTRASTGYATTSSGLLVPFLSNIPRITDLGLLVEQAETNLVLNSVGFGTGWAGSLAGTGSTGVGTAASGTAPDGTNTAVRLQLALNGGTTASDRSLWTQSITVSNATAYTNSLYFKSNTASTYVVQIGAPDGSGVAVTVTPTAWTRVQTTATTSSTTMTYQVRLRGGQTPTNSDSADILISGAQTELGSFPTSYIPTTTVAVTRAADNITLAGAAATAALAAKAAYFATNLVAGGTSPRLFQTTSTANAFFNSTTQASISDSLGNAANATIGGAGTYTGVVKTALGFDGTSITAKANGGTQATSAHAWDGTTGTVNLGNNSALTRALNGYIQRAAWGTVKGQFDGLTQ